MIEFVSNDSYREFASAVPRKTRYVHDDKVREFLNAVIATSESRKDSIERSSILFRAQRGYTWQTQGEGEEEYEIPDAYGPERMKPKAELVGDGRANPNGIACLYLAKSAEAAVAEVRPWVGSYVSLAQFKVMRDLMVVDCTKDKRIFPNWELRKDPNEIPTETREKTAWGEIGHAFSRPITPDEPPIEYVPTQILAEAFRTHGYDGIAYRSLLGDGLNIALFDCDAAELINCGLYEVRSVSFTFDQCTNPYFISKHYESLREQAVDAGNEPAQLSQGDTH